MKPSAATRIPDDRPSERVTRHAREVPGRFGDRLPTDGFDLSNLGFLLLLQAKM
jgi:hypothetical protein